MSITDIFSKRQRKLRGEVPDVYTYDKIPKPLTVQIIHIWTDTLGNHDDCITLSTYYPPFYAYKLIVETLRREYGRFSLISTSQNNREDYFSELRVFLLTEKDTEKILDAVELSFQCIDQRTRDFGYLHRHDASARADSAIEELNARFREHGVGYQFVD